MTTEPGSLTEYRNRYLDYLDGDRAAPPSMDSLNVVDRGRAYAWMRSLSACRASTPARFLRRSATCWFGAPQPDPLRAALAVILTHVVEACGKWPVLGHHSGRCCRRRFQESSVSGLNS